jgi:hypothetical protein
MIVVSSLSCYIEVEWVYLLFILLKCLRGGRFLSFGIGQLACFPFGLALETRLGTSLAGFRLLLQRLVLILDGLHVVDRFDQYALILELITLGEHVELVVNVLIDLLGVAHLLQQTTEDALTTHPQHLVRQSRIGGTATLTKACTENYWSSSKRGENDDNRKM